MVRSCGGRKRALGTRAPTATPHEANQRCGRINHFGALNNGRRFHYRAGVVVETLEGISGETGDPKTIQVDQSSEFVGRDLDLRTYAKGVTLDFSRPGKATDTAFAEAFNSRVRADCISVHCLLTHADAREKMEDWLTYDDEVRPHGAIGNKAPIWLQRCGGAPNQLL